MPEDLHINSTCEFVCAEVEHGVRIRDREEKWGRDWLKTMDALSLVVKEWNTFMFSPLTMTSLIFTELY